MMREFCGGTRMSSAPGLDQRRTVDLGQSIVDIVGLGQRNHLALMGFQRRFRLGQLGASILSSRSRSCLMKAGV